MQRKLFVLIILFLLIFNLSSCLPKDDSESKDVIPEYSFITDYDDRIEYKEDYFLFLNAKFENTYKDYEIEENVYYLILSFETTFDDEMLLYCQEPRFDINMTAEFFEKDFSSRQIVFKCFDNQNYLSENDYLSLILCSENESDFYFRFNPGFRFETESALYRYVIFYFKFYN